MTSVQTAGLQEFESGRFDSIAQHVGKIGIVQVSRTPASDEVSPRCGPASKKRQC
jgi:hypothetical protein